MAKIVIVDINPQLIRDLMFRTYLVHIEFNNLELYNKAVSLGFEKEVWEEKNNNKVLIKNES